MEICINETSTRLSRQHAFLAPMHRAATYKHADATVACIAFTPYYGAIGIVQS